MISNKHFEYVLTMFMLRSQPKEQVILTQMAERLSKSPTPASEKVLLDAGAAAGDSIMDLGRKVMAYLAPMTEADVRDKLGDVFGEEAVDVAYKLYEKVALADLPNQTKISLSKLMEAVFEDDDE